MMDTWARRAKPSFYCVRMGKMADNKGIGGHFSPFTVGEQCFLLRF